MNDNNNGLPPVLPPPGALTPPDQPVVLPPPAAPVAQPVVDAPMNPPAAPVAPRPDPLMSLFAGSNTPVSESKTESIRGTQNEDQSVSVDPTAVRNLGTAQLEKVHAENAVMQKEADVADKKAESLQFAAKNAREDAEKIAQLNANDQELAQKKFAALEALNADLKQSETIDPNRLMANKSTAGKIAAGLSVALGGLAMAYGAKENIGLNILNKAIEQDIDAQKATYENKYKRLQSSNYLYSQYMELLKDKAAARLATSNHMYDTAIKMAEATAARVPQGVVQDRMDANIAAMKEKQATQNVELSKIIHKNESVNKTQKITDTKSGKQAISPEMAFKVRELQPPPGYSGLAPSVQEAKDFREAVADHDAAQASIKKLIDYTNHPEARFSPTARRDAQTTAASLQGLLRKSIVGPGAVSSAEWKILKSVVADPTSLLSLPASDRAALQSLSKTADNKLDQHAKTLGYTKTGGGNGTFKSNESKTRK